MLSWKHPKKNMTIFKVQLSCLFNCIILSFKDTFNWTKFENSHWKWPWNTVVDSITHQKICDVPWFSIVFLSLPGSIDSLILLCNTSVSIHSPEDRTTGGRAPGVGVCPGPSTDWMNAKISWPDVIRCCWNRVIKKKSPGKKSPCLRVVCVFSIWVVYSWFSTISSHKKNKHLQGYGISKSMEMLDISKNMKWWKKSHHVYDVYGWYHLVI